MTPWNIHDDPRSLVDLAPPPSSERFCQHTLTHRCTELRHAGPKGHGVFATSIIYPGEAVGMFSGPTITTREICEEPIETYKGQYSLQICDNLWTTPLPQHIYRFINNSCDGNLWFRSGNTLVANRVILPGEEISFRYDAADADFPFTFPCYCGSKNCTGKYEAGRWRREDPTRIRPWEWSPFLVQRWREQIDQSDSSRRHINQATANFHLRIA